MLLVVGPNPQKNGYNTIDDTLSTSSHKRYNAIGTNRFKIRPSWLSGSSIIDWLRNIGPHGSFEREARTHSELVRLQWNLKRHIKTRGRLNQIKSHRQYRVNRFTNRWFHTHKSQVRDICIDKNLEIHYHEDFAFPPAVCSQKRTLWSRLKILQ